ncbi:response regulator [bacterium AH-315-F18]|nr:response regulator [bacterium AH-315-F18]
MDASRKTVLVVDDKPANLDVMRTILKGFHVKAALGGEHAIDIARKTPSLGLVLLDINMPDMDGYEALSKLQSIPGNEKVPVIFVTARKETCDEEKGLALGAVDYITKPVVPAIVRARVKTHLELYGARHEADQLLSKTLVGSIKVLMDILALLNPDAFHRATRLREAAGALAERLELPALWRFQIAAMFSQIGYFNVPPSVMDKHFKREGLSLEEKQLLSSGPLIGQELLDRIPRLEEVGAMIGQQEAPLDPKLAQADFADWNSASLGGHLLKTVIEFDRRLSLHQSPQVVLEEMSKHNKDYLPAMVLGLLAVHQAKPIQVERNVKLSELEEGMVLRQEIKTGWGMTLAPKNSPVSGTLLNQLLRLSKEISIQEPIRVLG